MKKSKFLLYILLVAVIGFSSCSKKGKDRIIGKWKAIDFADTMIKSMQVDVTYEFTKDTIINEGTVHGQQMPALKIPYIVKSDIGDTIVLEATHPQSNVKGEFKIVVNGDKMNMIDPGQTSLTLQKQ